MFLELADEDLLVGDLLFQIVDLDFMLGLDLAEAFLDLKELFFKLLHFSGRSGFGLREETEGYESDNGK